MEQNSLVYLVRQRSTVEPIKLKESAFVGDTVIDDEFLEILKSSLGVGIQVEKQARDITPKKRKKKVPPNLKEFGRRLDVHLLHLVRLVKDLDLSRAKDVDNLVAPIIAVHKRLEPKNRAKRGYSMFYCADKQPLIKTYYGVEEYLRILSDLDYQAIASKDLVSLLTHSFENYKGTTYLQGNFELTPDGYKKFQEFLLELPSLKRKGNGDSVAKVYKRNPYIAYNLLLKKRKEVLVVQTPLANSQLGGNRFALVRKSGLGVSGNTLTLPTTNQDINDYLYDVLLRTYSDMKEVLS